LITDKFQTALRKRLWLPVEIVLGTVSDKVERRRPRRRDARAPFATARSSKKICLAFFVEVFSLRAIGQNHTQKRANYGLDLQMSPL
jgi:hypothetical protein